MTTTEIATMIASIGFPSAYDHFPEKEAPALPFICFRYDQPNNFNADNTTQQKIASLSVELYTANKDISSENAVEAVLVDNDMPYIKTETYIDGEKMYLNLYETEVILNG
jgi:hypothetical protein